MTVSFRSAFSEVSSFFVEKKKQLGKIVGGGCAMVGVTCHVSLVSLRVCVSVGSFVCARAPLKARVLSVCDACVCFCLSASAHCVLCVFVFCVSCFGCLCLPALYRWCFFLRFRSLARLDLFFFFFRALMWCRKDGDESGGSTDSDTDGESEESRRRRRKDKKSKKKEEEKVPPRLFCFVYSICYFNFYERRTTPQVDVKLLNGGFVSGSPAIKTPPVLV